MRISTYIGTQYEVEMLACSSFLLYVVLMLSQLLAPDSYMRTDYKLYLRAYLGSYSTRSCGARAQGTSSHREPDEVIEPHQDSSSPHKPFMPSQTERETKGKKAI